MRQFKTMWSILSNMSLLNRLKIQMVISAIASSIVIILAIAILGKFFFFTN